MVDSMAVAAARNVVNTTTMASSLKASTLPGLNPNHPTQSSRMPSVNQPGLISVGTLGLVARPARRSLPHNAYMMPSPACGSGAVDNQPAGEIDHPDFREPPTRVPDPGRREVPDEDEVHDRIDEEG